MAGSYKERATGQVDGDDYAPVAIQFKQAVVRQAAHYAGLVLPRDEDDEGERRCLRAVLAWCAQPSSATMRDVESAALLVSANMVEHIGMVTAACCAVWAAQAASSGEAAKQAIEAVMDAAGRHGMRGSGDYMGRAIGKHRGKKIAVAWQAEVLTALLTGSELPPFLPLPELPGDHHEIVNLFKELYSEVEAHEAGDLTVLVDYMSAEQQERFRRALAYQAVHWAEQFLPPAAEDKREQVVQGRIHLAIDGAAQAVGAVAEAWARQWQAAAAAAIVRGQDMPGLADKRRPVGGSRGAYLEGNLEGLVLRLDDGQRLLFKQFGLQRAIELAEQVLPPEQWDRGHRRCILTARKWLADPTEENRAAAWAAAWKDAPDAPSWPKASTAESAAWLTARGAAETAAEPDVSRAAMKLLGVALTAATVLNSARAVDTEGKAAAECMKSLQIEEAWRLLQGNEEHEASSFWALLEQMTIGQRRALAQALEKQAEWYAAYAPLQESSAPPWGDRPENMELTQTFTASLVAEIRKELEHTLGYALRSLDEAKSAEVYSALLALNAAADHIAIAALEAGKRKARRWQIEAAWAILHDYNPPEVEPDTV